MLGTDFRSFIEAVKAKYPAEYVEVDRLISGAYEITAIVIDIKAITHRRGATLQDICGGPHRKQLLRTTIPIEPSILHFLQMNIPGASDRSLARL
ncbi:MAG: hypothetical protein HYX74_06970 [Acidobacteria bacterium]|nr:hypothetical protein [Acidobacteriota bacterium]